MLADVMGVTGRLIGELMRETMPQLRFSLRHRGRVLWPRIAPTVEAGFAPTPEMAKKIIADERERRAKPDAPVFQTAEEQERHLAWKIVRSRWTKEDPFETEEDGQTTKPLPGVSPAAAAAALAWAASADCPGWIYTRDIVPFQRALVSTAG